MTLKEQKVPPRQTGLSRLIAATGYSLQGLRHAVVNEAAFRQEVGATVVSVALVLLLPVPWGARVGVIGANLLVLITELLNTAVEALADRVSPEYDVHAKQAKDMGSAAVLLALMTWGVCWLFALYAWYQKAQ